MKESETIEIINDPVEDKLREILEREEQRITGKAASTKIECHGYCNECQSRLPCEAFRIRTPYKTAGV